MSCNICNKVGAVIGYVGSKILLSIQTKVAGCYRAGFEKVTEGV